MRRQIGVFLAGVLFGALVLLGLVRLFDSDDTDLSSSLAPAVRHESPSVAVDVGSAAPTSDTPEPDAPPQYPYRIVGRVIDSQERPVAGARVSALDRDRDLERIAESGPEGEFEILDLPLGLYAVEASASGFEGAGLRGVAPDGPAIELVLDVGGDLVGSVVGEGVDVAGLTVLAGGPGLFPPRAVTTDPRGGFSLADLAAAAHVELAALGEGAGTGFGTTITRDDRSAVVLEAREAPPLAIHVVEAGTDRPVASGIVSLSGGPLHVLAVGEVVEDGVALLRGIPTGSVYVRVRAPGYLPWEGTIAHDGHPQRVVLGRGATVSGRVVDEQGGPLPAAVIFANAFDRWGRRWRFGRELVPDVDRLVRPDGSPLWPPWNEVVADATGAFRLSGIPPGRLSLAAELSGYEGEPTEQIEINGEGEIEGVELTLRRVE